MAVDLARVEEIFGQALGTADAAARSDYLDAACGDDAELRARIDGLLAAHVAAGSFLKLPGDDRMTSPYVPLSEGPRSKIGRYKLLEQIGEGGFGVVFMAEQDEPVRRLVALKIIKLGMDTRQVVARFEAERQALALMDHPCVAKVFDGGATETGRPYFVMELVKGVPITEYCDNNNLSIPARLELFCQVCHAVQHAHQKGLIHRDIKPSNVIVSTQDNRPVAKVIDFGVAKAMQARLTEKTLFTEFQQLIGTPAYMSPEQCAGSLDIDTRSDVYSLGVLLYELLTGTPPFDPRELRSKPFAELQRIIREEEPPTPSTRLGSLSDTLPAIAAHRAVEPRKLAAVLRGELDWIVMKCLEKDRTRRYETASSLAADVARYLADEPVAACPPSAAYQLRKFVRRNRRSLTTAAVISLFLFLLVGAIGWAMRDRSAREAKFALERSQRQAVLERGVRSALDEVQAGLQRQNWNEAAAALKRAEGLLAAGAPNRELQQRIQSWRTDLDALTRLEDIRLAYQNSEQEGWDFRPAALAGYEQTFRALGIDIDALPIDENAARIRARPIADHLIAALDDWAHVRAVAATEKVGSASPDVKTWRQRPLTVARAADNGEFPNRVRTALLDGDSSQIAVLAGSPEALHLPASTLALLARRVEDRELAISLLAGAQHAHADDFRLNMMLASRVMDVEGTEVTKLYGRKELRPASLQGGSAVGYASAGVALRPDNGWAWATLGNALYQAQRFDESNDAYRRAIELKPDFFGAYINLSRTLYQQGKLSESIEASRRAIELNPNIPEAHTNLGIVLHEQGHHDEAIASLRKAIEIQPDFATAHSNLGTLLHARGQFDEAIAEFHVALKLRPNDADDYSSLGRALTFRGDLEPAIEACRKAIELAPDLAVAYSNLGIALRAQGKQLDAVAALHKAIELRPDHATNYCELGATLEELGQAEDAIEAYRTSIKLNPTETCSYTKLGAILLQRGELNQALELLRTVAGLDPENAQAHSNVGIALKELGRFEEAIAACRRAIELQPESAPAYRSLGNVLHASGQLDEAIKAFHKATEIEPADADAYCDLGEALEDNNQLNEAIDANRKAIELNPEFVSAHNNLASVLYTLDRLDEAVSAIRKAIELDPNEPITHLNLGCMLSSQGKFQEAVGALRKAIELDPSNADSYSNLGEALHSLGQSAEAIEALQKSVELQPDIDRYRTLAAVLSDEGRYGEAIAAYRKLIDLKPDDAAAYTNLAAHLQAAGQPEEAIQASQKAIELRADDGDAYNNLGNAYTKLGRLEEAIAAYRNAVKYEPNYAGSQCNLAHALLKRGDREEATATYQKAMELEPDAALCNEVAWMLATAAEPDLRLPELSVDFAERGAKLEPANGNVWNTLGVARYRAGQWQPAIEALEKSMALRAGGDANDWLFLAMSHWQLDKKDDARQWYDESVDWIKTNPAPNKELERFRAEAADLLGIARP
jgi:tetratricopeptide (TPR) repeat protein/serine/threonine protein kinase